MKGKLVCCVSHNVTAEINHILSALLGNSISIRVISVGPTFGLPSFEPGDRVILFGQGVVDAVLKSRNPIFAYVRRSEGIVCAHRVKGGGISCLIAQELTAYDTMNADSMLLFNRGIRELMSDIKYIELSTVRYKVCDNVDVLKELDLRFSSESVVGFDVETVGFSPFKTSESEGVLYSVAFAFSNGESYALPVCNFTAPFNKEVKKVISKFLFKLPLLKKVAHNLKFDLLWLLVNYGDGRSVNDLKGEWHDTVLLSHMIDERRGLQGLKGLCWRYLGINDWSVDTDDVREVPINELLSYNSMDCYYTIKLLEALLSRINKSRIAFYKSFLLKSLLCFTGMQMRGVMVDMEYLGELELGYKKAMDTLNKQIRQVTGNYDAVTPISVKHLSTYFNSKGYKMNVMTPSGSRLSVSASNLQSIYSAYKDEIALKCVQYNKLQKVYSTYIKGTKKFVSSGDRVHPVYNMVATVTGRTSCAEPNMQNYPQNLGKDVRKAFKAPDGYKIVSFDYGQIEARLFAVITADSNYVSDLFKGFDIHEFMAIELFHKRLGWSLENAKKRRSDVKAGLVFAALYGAGIKNIATNLKVTEPDAVYIRNLLFSRYPAIRKWQKDMLASMKANGYVESLFGRRRHSPASYTETLNFVPQSTASDITLMAMINLKQFECMAMIHDDLTFLLKESDKLPNICEHIIRIMLTSSWERMSKFSGTRCYVPLSVQVSMGKAWGDVKSIYKVDALKLGADTIENAIKIFNKSKKVCKYTV